MDIPIDARVYCSDGFVGRAMLVIINPTTNKVTNIVVKEQQEPHTGRLVPMRYVVETDDDQIRLSCRRERLQDFREFVQTEYVRADLPVREGRTWFTLQPFVVPAWIATKHASIPRGELGIRRGARVTARDGRVGRLDEFAVEATTGGITHLIMRSGHLWGQEEVAIPVSAIERIEEDRVFLKVDRKEVEALAGVQEQRKWT
jgi:sporulation protein YlmC with PRC-barrel domain